MDETQKEFLNTYVDINRDGDIIFKSVLNLNIMRESISKQQALNIIYDVLHEITTRRIYTMFDIDKTLIPNLIEEYKKSMRLNHKDYHNEINIFIDYIKYLTKKRNIKINVLERNKSLIYDENNNQITINNSNSYNKIKHQKTKSQVNSNKVSENNQKNNNSHTSNNNETKDSTNFNQISDFVPKNTFSNEFVNREPKRENYHYSRPYRTYGLENTIFRLSHKLNVKKVKSYLKKYNKEELCGILGYNPQSCFESEKSLRNEIIQIMRENSFNDYKIESLSYDEFKKSFNKLNTKKFDEKDIIRKTKKFNDKSLDEMMEDKEEYYDLYCFLSQSKSKNTFADTFIEYYDLVNDNSFIEFYEYLNNNNHLISDFNNVISDDQQFLIPEKIIEEYDELDEFCLDIDNYPNVIQSKIFSEFDWLEKVKSIFDDLNEYDTYYDTPDYNLIKIHNKKVLDSKINALDVNTTLLNNFNDSLNENKDVVPENSIDLDDYDEIFDYTIVNDENEFKITYNLTSDSINHIISKIDVDSYEIINNDLNEEDKHSLISDLKSYTSNITFKFSTKSFDENERNNIISEIESDINNGIIYGDISSIVPFYFDNYKTIKNKVLSLIYLEEYVESKLFYKFLDDNYFENIPLDLIIEKVKKDIIDEKILIDDIQTKINIYFEQFEQKSEQNEELNHYIEKYESLMKNNNLTDDELNNIFNKIQILIDDNYGSMKSIGFYLDKEIKHQISMNQSEARKRLSSFSVNQLADILGKSEEECQFVLDEVEKMIYYNKIRYEKINLEFLYVFSIELENCD